MKAELIRIDRDVILPTDSLFKASYVDRVNREQFEYDSYDEAARNFIRFHTEISVKPAEGFYRQLESVIPNLKYVDDNVVYLRDGLEVSATDGYDHILKLEKCDFTDNSGEEIVSKIKETHSGCGILYVKNDSVKCK